jgi:hypothetical protein
VGRPLEPLLDRVGAHREPPEDDGMFGATDRIAREPSP